MQQRITATSAPDNALIRPARTMTCIKDQLDDANLTSALLPAADSPARTSPAPRGRKEREFRTAGWSTAIQAA